jgi:hypothetical protein
MSVSPMLAKAAAKIIKTKDETVEALGEVPKK